MKLLPMVLRLKIPYVTIYALSTENWARDKAEIQGLMQLVRYVLTKQLQIFIKQDIRIRIIGSREHLPPGIDGLLDRAEQETAHCSGMVLGICFNYGGQQEIADACKGVMASGVEAGGVTPELIASHLYAADMPPLDLVVRTSGEQRLSGFMLWQASYAELYFTDVLWPDFDEAELTKALRDYAARGRRFGS